MTPAEREQIIEAVIEGVMSRLFPPATRQELLDRASQGDLTAIDDWNKMQKEKR